MNDTVVDEPNRNTIINNNNNINDMYVSIYIVAQWHWIPATMFYLFIGIIKSCAELFITRTFRGLSVGRLVVNDSITNGV